MQFDFSFLDYIWRGLFAGSAISGILLMGLIPLSLLIKKYLSNRQMKWLYNNQILFLLTLLSGIFLFVTLSDPELANACFQKFIVDHTMLSATRSLAAVWVVGVIVFLARDLLRIYSSYQIVQQLPRLKQPNIQRIVTQAAKRMNMPTDIDLRMTTKLTSPFVSGFFNFKMVISSDVLKKLDSPSLESIVCHELSHIQDRDSVWLALELLCRRLLFFNPLIYFLNNAYLVTIEKAADETAVQIGLVQQNTLIQSLVEISSLCQNNSTSPMDVCASRSFKEIKSRMESVAQMKKETSQLRFYWTLFASLVASLGISIAQAKYIAGDQSALSSGSILMCSQVQHEKIIESWFVAEPTPNKCEN